VVHTIALVDDDRNILTSVSMALEAEGFAVRTFTDGDTALRGLSSRPVDLAILDIKMPRMDGMELLQHLRELGAAQERALELGADAAVGEQVHERGAESEVLLLRVQQRLELLLLLLLLLQLLGDGEGLLRVAHVRGGAAVGGGRGSGAGEDERRRGLIHRRKALHDEVDGPAELVGGDLVGQRRRGGCWRRGGRRGGGRRRAVDDFKVVRREERWCRRRGSVAGAAFD